VSSYSITVSSTWGFFVTMFFSATTATIFFGDGDFLPAETSLTGISSSTLDSSPESEVACNSFFICFFSAFSSF
jgi:hypothetical protein